MFQPLDHAPAYQRLSGEIRRRIVARDLPDGLALPTETELARQFAVNRSTVREALRNLESAGLLTRRHGGKRLYVTRPTLESVGDGVSEAIALHDARFADVWEAMLTLEPAIAAAAAERRDAPAIAAMAAAAAAFAAGERLAPAAVAVVVSYFRALGAATCNPVFMLLHEPLLRLFEPSLAIMIDEVPQARGRIAAAQRRILEAVQAGDGAGASNWMLKHIRDFRRGYELAGIPLATTVAAL